MGYAAWDFAAFPISSYILIFFENVIGKQSMRFAQFCQRYCAQGNQQQGNLQIQNCLQHEANSRAPITNEWEIIFGSPPPPQSIFPPRCPRTRGTD